MANQVKGKAKLATKKPNKVESKKSPKKLSKLAAKASQEISQQYSVFGVVLSADAEPATGITVLAYDNDVASQDLLGQVVTDAKGAYAINYTEALFKRTSQERGGADIVVRVLNAQQKSLFASKKKNNAPAKYELNIQLTQTLEQLNLAPELIPAGKGEPASLGDVLSTMKSDWLKVKLNKVLELTKTTDHKADDFLDHAKTAGFSKAQALQLRQTFNLSDVTQKNVPLMNALLPQVSGDKDGSLKGLATLKPNDWLNHAFEFGTPPQSFVTHAQYAGNLQTSLENLVPNEVLKEKFKDDSFVLIPQEYNGVKAVINKYKDFDIAKTNIDEFAEGNKGIKPETTKALRKLQHLKRLNASWDEASVLINKGVDDAEEISNFNKDQLKDILGEQIAIDRINQIHDQSTAIVGKSIGILANFLPMAYGVGSAVMTDKSFAAHKSQINGNATLRRLFGDLDNCACDPCLSVLSPAAYLADLLKFIDASLDVRLELESRRPDIFDLELSCDNTKVELPQIDLALEILENAVALPYSIELATSTDISNELVNGMPVGSQVLNALQKTSKDKLDNLVAVIDNYSRISLIYIPGKSHWIIKDKYRTWALESFTESIGLSLTYRFVSLDNRKVIYQKLENELQNGTIPEVIADEVSEALGKEVGLKLPFGQDDLNLVEIKQVDSNPYIWLFNYSFTADIQIDKNSITVSRLDGLNYVINANEKLLIAFVRELNNGDVTGNLIAYLNNQPIALGPKGIVGASEKLANYEVKRKDKNRWTIEVHSSITLVYRPTSINIKGLTYQSTATDRDLFVRPQNTNPLAYKKISQLDSCFPWSLPYNQAFNETRETLNVAGVTRLSLLELTTLPEEQYLSLEIAKERLGLYTEELSLITTSELKANKEANEKFYKIWGLNGKSKQELKDTHSDEDLDEFAFGEKGLLTRVSILMQQSNLSFSEFSSLLESDFINPSNLIAIETQLSCKPSEMFLNKKDEIELAPFLDRLHRFVRLWRKTGWQVWELDLAIQANGIGDQSLSNNAIVQIANLNLLKQRLNLAIDVIVAMIGGFSDKRYNQFVKNEIVEVSPLYNRIFQNRQLIDPPKQELAFAEAILTLDVSLTELIAASVGLRKSELTFILNSIDIDVPRTILNDTQAAKNELLQQLFRNAMLTKALGLSLYDYESAWQLFSSNHFESPASLLSFIDELDFVKNSGFSLGELTYLLLDSTINPSASNIELTQDRADEVLKALQEELKQLLAAESDEVQVQKRTELVVKHMALFTELEQSFVNEILKSYLSSPDTTTESVIQYLSSDEFMNVDDGSSSSSFVILERLHKIALLNAKWKASLTELAWTSALIAEVNVFDGLSFNSLLSIEMISQEVVTKWRQTTALFQLAHTSLEMAQVVANYLLAYQNANNLEEISEALASLVTSFSLSEATVEACANKLAISSSQYLSPLYFSALIKLLSTVHQLGIDSAGLTSLVTETAFEKSAELASKILKSQFTDSGWQKALRKISDVLRIQERDRLVDYLLAKDGMRDVNELYKHYLIDFEMSPCMNTTRTLQSTASVQLFVQRCLFNLEQPNVMPNLIDRKRWEWMQNYRVWEANRKVFLYPENWLFPEVRDDRTETFKAFESALTQSEASHENAEKSFKKYLEDLIDISEISIISNYVDNNTLYQLGKTPNLPNQFYFRKCLNIDSNNMVWTGWSRIDVEINANNSVIFIYRNVIYIAWLKLKNVGEVTENKAQISVQWIEQQTNGWVKLKNTDDNLKIEFDCLPNVPLEKQVFLNTSKIGEQFYQLNIYANKVGQADLSRYKKNINLASKIEGPYYNSSQTLPPGIVYFANRPSDGKCRISIYPTVYEKYSDGLNSYYLQIPIQNFPYPYLVTVRIDGLYQPVNRFGISSFFYIDVTKEYDSGATNGQSKTHQVEIEILDTAHRVIGTYQGGQISYEDKSDHQYFVTQIDDKGVPPEISANIADASSLKLIAGVHFSISGKAKLITGDNHSLVAPTNTFADMGQYVEISNNSRPTIFNSKTILDGSQQETFYLNTVQADRFWWLEENGMRFLVRLDLANDKLKVIPSSYPEVLEYKSNTLEKLFTVFQLTDLSDNNRVFNCSNLRNYFNNLGGLQDPRSLNNIAFDLKLPNALYNWEVFYHLPTTIGIFLTRQHRFEEARTWFHFVFDPTTNDASNGRERFWKFLPFRNAEAPDNITQLLEVLSGKPGNNNIQDQISAWLADPFNPFAVARLRNNAFEWYTLISYIKNLTDWADQLFRRDTRESINEATLLYIMAAEILGPRPEKIRLKNDDKQSLSYRTLRGSKQNGLDDFSNVWLGMVTEAELEQASQRAHQNDESEAYYNQLLSLASIGSLYFKVPANENLPELWDMVDDRLFKIRHCQNIEGVRRSLPLYEPPIDPELLIRAKEAGLDLADVLADRFAPLPHYRFQVLLQKANEFCSEVKNLGSAILSAVEKKESEHLALLRSSQEIDMLKLVESIKHEQIKETQANIESLSKTKSNALDRFVYLQRQLGKSELSFDANGSPIVEQSLITQVQETGVSGDIRSLSLIGNEVDQLGKMQDAHNFAMASSILKIAGGVAHTVGAAVEPTGVAARVANAIGSGLSTTADGIGMISSINSYLGTRSSIVGGWQRRRDEWVQQSKMTAEEIRQIDKQMIALEIRKSIAEKELDNHRKQIENVTNIDDYMRHMKFTGESLYGWMENQLSSLFFTAYQMAYDLAKKAEMAYQYELGEPLSKFVQYGQWDSLRKGLLSGERLSQNLRRMEVAHLERNKRELEITKHISLRQLDPFALMALRNGASCEFNIPEVLLDMDFPGHYFRRIKSVSISVPCVVGPYTSVNGTLTLLTSKYRDKTLGDYTTEEDNYKTSFLTTQSIATSGGQNDSGVFELNFRDERYLPFEGAGVISNWRFALPKDFKSFDYSTISDVILHVRYTARDGGEDFARKANTEVQKNLNALKAQGESDEGLWLLLDLRNDYPQEYSRYKESKSTKKVILEINSDRFPFVLRGKSIKAEKVKFIKESLKDIDNSDINIMKDDSNLSQIKVEVLESHFNKERWLALRYTITG